MNSWMNSGRKVALMIAAMALLSLAPLKADAGFGAGLAVGMLMSSGSTNCDQHRDQYDPVRANREYQASKAAFAAKRYADAKEQLSRAVNDDPSCAFIGKPSDAKAYFVKISKAEEAARNIEIKRGAKDGSILHDAGAILMLVFAILLALLVVGGMV